MLKYVLFFVTCLGLLNACSAPPLTPPDTYMPVTPKHIHKGFVAVQLEGVSSPHTLHITFTSDEKGTELDIDGGTITWKNEMVLHELPGAKITTNQRNKSGQYAGSISVTGLVLNPAHYTVTLNIVENDQLKTLTYLLSPSTLH